ncbi:cytochrome ubiquinol oxidase subunit I [Epidermidibacterium keratini]|uniref:Cytochrome ubiquinol oxidase subunit I n=1 Tax=Epidermidibacterium keratini TaxID=1891644 RepID=A0A7L4YMG7_9ACTN|nr:cytochrome ubiquinol oxidase subunit I [Epidermidibacterium keratini]QHC00252.1 cytochrome ubiquinol oxidase subunit I [Epidermidibacterium keratini]
MGLAAPSDLMLDVSRWQFAFTIAFHMTFPAITVGLSVFLAATYAMFMRTHKPIYLQIFRFWKKIFAVGFALGVVAGTVITFEFGLNWGPFAAATGPILGPIIGMEVVTAFFLEAGFVGVMLYGDGRVKERTMLICCSLVALGTILSTTWILSANSWMQTPAGYRFEDGQFVPENWWQVIFNPSFAWRFPHMLLAVLIAAALLIAGVAAYYLVRGRAREFARRTFSVALGVLALLLPIQLFVGDNIALQYIVPHQLPKLEALEGNWDSTNTGYQLLVIPDQDGQQNLWELSVPWFGSAIGAKDLSGNTPVPGLAMTPPEDQPNMTASFYGFRAMFYGSMLIFIVAFGSVVLRLRRRLYRATWFHKLVMWLTPVGVIAIIGGWVTAEAGRQPWVVYGQMRTEDGVSQLSEGAVIGSFVGFLLIYLTLFAVWLWYVIRQVKRGPEDVSVDEIDPDPDPVRGSVAEPSTPVTP